jgi:exopolyphosphatase / guanosine-5'-triphosphate,3'-diphosphate pyrophosphatase
VGAERARLSREQRQEVERLCRRYSVSLVHARHVAATATSLFSGLQPVHQLPPEAGRLLEAAAYLLDVGHFISSASHHKHSHYVVANSDMAGFTERERMLVAGLCRYHRKSMPNATHSSWQALSPEERRLLLHLVPILRLADNLDRGREQRVSGVACRLDDAGITVAASAARDIDLEQWAAERVAEVFHQVYGRAIAVVRARG